MKQKLQPMSVDIPGFAPFIPTLAHRLASCFLQVLKQSQWAQQKNQHCQQTTSQVFILLVGCQKHDLKEYVILIMP